MLGIQPIIDKLRLQDNPTLDRYVLASLNLFYLCCDDNVGKRKQGNVF